METGGFGEREILPTCASRLAKTTALAILHLHGKKKKKRYTTGAYKRETIPQRHTKRKDTGVDIRTDCFEIWKRIIVAGTWDA